MIRGVNNLYVVQFLNDSPLPFRIVETFLTIDGTRSRLTHNSFKTQAEAEGFIKALQETQQ